MLHKILDCLLFSIIFSSCTIEEPILTQTPILNSIPIIVITSEDTIVKEQYTNAKVTINYNGLDNNFNTYTYDSKIRVRGNSTSVQPKKPYKLKFTNKVNLFGMGREHKWVLLANYFDVTLLRNHIANKIGKELNLQSTPDGVFVDVFLNQEYIGNYYLTEQIELSTNRVFGKAIFEVDHKFHEDETVIHFSDVFNEDYGLPYVFKDPESPSEELKTYYTSYLMSFYSNIYEYACNGYERNTKQFNDWVVLDSWFAYHIIQELFKNPDAWSFSSIYFTITYDDKICMGPLWDFDLSAGNYSILDATHSDLFVFNNPQGEYIFTNMFVKAILTSYQHEFKNYWNSNKDKIFSTIQSIDNDYKYIQTSANCNFERWYSNGNCQFNNQCSNTLDSNVEYLKYFLFQRFFWMDEHINSIN